MSSPSSAGSCRGAAAAACPGNDGSARCGSGSDTATRRFRPMPPVMMSNKLRAVLGGAGGGAGGEAGAVVVLNLHAEGLGSLRHFLGYHG